MTKRTAKHCDKCTHFRAYDATPDGAPPQELCAKGHRPRFYVPTTPVDPDWGYKRRCQDFAPVPPLSDKEKSLLSKLFDTIFPWRRNP